VKAEEVPGLIRPFVSRLKKPTALKSIKEVSLENNNFQKINKIESKKRR
jgi:hypothetical protein